MKVSSERIEGCQVALNIEAEPEEMERALEGAYRRLVKKAAVPGFRKGKAPRTMLERNLGRAALVNEAWERLVPELYEQAVKEQGIEALAQPHLEVTQVDPLMFKATVPVRPVVELGDYRSIKVTPETVEITEENITEAMERLRRTQVLWEPVEREARLGDLVAIDVEGSVEGKPLPDSRSELYHLLPDSKTPVPGFAGQIEGMKAGEGKEFILPFPEDHPNSKLAGKDCLFKVSISEVKEEHLPELDDEFAKSLGHDLETMDQLREKIAGNLKAAADSEARNKLERQVVEAMVGLANLEFSAVLTEREVERMAQQQAMALGVDLGAYLRFRNLTEEKFRGQLRTVAEKRVASALILQKVVEEEKMEVSDWEVNVEVERLVKDAGENGKRVREATSPEAWESLRDQLLSRKVIDFLVRIATSEDDRPAGLEEA
ncbi:MAG: trigger factor [Dehalococcoidia bacterium]|nr:Trigger factor [Chloroflexota bacterium]